MMLQLITTVKNKIITFLKNLLIPPYCVYCRKWLSSDTIFCDSCFKKIKPITSKKLLITKTKSVNVIAISDYQDPLKRLILAKGFSHILASRQLGKLIIQLTNIKNTPFDYMVPVPLHWTRYAWRGYNQAHEIARVLSKETNRSILTVNRITKTKPQSSFTRLERVANVQNVFSIPPQSLSQLKDKHILIIDDLMTTGATISGLARELYKAKPLAISAVVACRVL